MRTIVAASLMSAVFLSAAIADEVQVKKQELVEKQAEQVQESRKESIELAQKSNESMQQVSRASKIMGASVRNPNGDKLGDIKDLVLNPENGQVVYAVVSFGGVLGMGDKLFAIPFRALHWVVEKEYYALSMDKETLKSAPGFDKKHWPDSSDKWDLQREGLNQFYRVAP